MAMASAENIAEIIRRTRVSVPSEPTGSFKTKGEALKAKIDLARRNEDTIRYSANILAYATGSNDGLGLPPLDPGFSIFDDSLIKALESPIDRNSVESSQRAKHPGELYTLPLPISQEAPMQPAMARLIEVTRALETFNEEARTAFRQLNIDLENLEQSGEAKDRFVPTSAPATPMMGTGPFGQAGVAFNEGRRPSLGAGRGLSSVNRERDPRMVGR